jgi:hypothetical protein
VAIGERAVDGWEAWPEAWVIPHSADNVENMAGLHYLLRVLTMGDVEVRSAQAAFTAGGETFPQGSFVIDMSQPYASFAQTMLEVQVYPDLREYPGGPPLRPYDVTAHTLPLLFDVDAVAIDEEITAPLGEPMGIPDWRWTLPEELTGEGAPRVGVYKGWREPMEGGWTRWMLDQHEMAYDTLHDARMRAGDLNADYDVILFQAQNGLSITEGYSEGQLPPEYTGGIGEEGTAALRDFVVNGGRIVAIEESTEFVADLFDLAISNRVERLPSQDFYIPGSILELELEDHPENEGLEPIASAWYWRSSRVFDVSDPAIEVLARFSEAPLLSGWVLGAEHVAGQPAVVRADVGEGSVVLFGFQPNYRAQTVATWPLLFRALAPPN